MWATKSLTSVSEDVLFATGIGFGNFLKFSNVREEPAWWVSVASLGSPGLIRLKLRGSRWESARYRWEVDAVGKWEASDLDIRAK